MTKRFALSTLLFAFIALPALADFNAIARAIGRHDGVKRVWIPFLGVARAAVWIVGPQGVHDFQLATFEGADHLNPRELHALLETKLGDGYLPLVRVWSKKSREWSFVYARPGKRDRMEVVVLARDASDTVLVRVEIDATVLARELNAPRNVGRNVGQNVGHDVERSARR